MGDSTEPNNPAGNSTEPNQPNIDTSTVSTSPWDFAGLCETGECPAGWNREEESCVINLIGLEETVAREECGKYRGDFSSATQDRFQCKGGANFMNI